MLKLRYENVSFTYGAQDNVLDGISLDVSEGEFVCVLGANGSGKSTLAKLACGLLLPTEGRVRACGLDASDPDNLMPIRSRMGLVFQNPDDQLVSSIVQDDVAFGPRNLGVCGDELVTRVGGALEAVGLSDLAERDVSALSGGEKQRVAIAGALAMRPEVLVLDEPTSMLDPCGRNQLMDICQKLNGDGLSVIHITHFVEEARRASRVIVLDSGRIVLDGPPDEILARTDDLRLHGVIAPLDDLAKPARQTASDNAPVLEFLNVSHSYRPKRDAPSRPALDDVTLDVREGEILGISGPTGSGKSTFLQLAAALLDPESGTVAYRGRPLSDKKAARLARADIGIVFQYPERQLFAATVFDDVAFGPRNQGLSAPGVESRVADALGAVGLDLESLRDASPFALSGGQMRLVAIAGTLAMRPRVLLLDEPSAGLDGRARRLLAQVILDLGAGGIAQVLVSHDDELLAALADRVLVLREGRIVKLGTPDELFSTPTSRGETQTARTDAL